MPGARTPACGFGAGTRDPQRRSGARRPGPRRRQRCNKTSAARMRHTCWNCN